MSALRPSLVLLGMVIATGCPSTAPAPLPSGLVYTFPHAVGFEAGVSHGVPWVERPAGCEQCHRSEQAIRFVRTCTDCHSTYPHPEGFASGTAHGSLALDGGLSCGPCHGTGERAPAGQQGGACRGCHQDYPHRLTWAEPGVHGPIAQARLETCAVCHGDDWQGGAEVDACGDCHALFPHATLVGDDSGGPPWSDPDVHGQAALEHGTAACGGSCHGTEFDGGLSGVACGRCHAPFPHGADYRLQHRSDVSAYGEASCLGCHVDDRGFPADFTCAESCHGEAP